MSHWVIEGSVVEVGGGAVIMLLRSTEGFIYSSSSMDKGERKAFFLWFQVGAVILGVIVIVM
jgi:hypothetical protein